MSNICDETVSALDEPTGYIASPGYTSLHSAATVPDQHQTPHLCTLSISIPSRRGYSALYVYLRDLDFRTTSAWTTPGESNTEESSPSDPNYFETCLHFVERLSNKSDGQAHSVCAKKDLMSGGLAFMSKSLHVEISYWTVSKDFHDFLIYYAGKVKFSFVPKWTSCQNFREGFVCSILH